MGEKKKEKTQPNSLPFLCKSSVTPKHAAPGALNRHVHWESQETPVALSHLSASVHTTGYWRST